LSARSPSIMRSSTAGSRMRRWPWPRMFLSIPSSFWLASGAVHMHQHGGWWWW
jgi:hypothetical protein